MKGRFDIPHRDPCPDPRGSQIRQIVRGLGLHDYEKSEEATQSSFAPAVLPAEVRPREEVVH